MCRFAQTLRPTGSGSGDAKASGQGLSLFRPLDDPLVCGLQARLRTFPGNDSLGTRRDEMLLIQGRGQEGGIQVPLDGTDSTDAVMPALRKGLFHASAAAMTELAQLASACGDLDQGAARARNGALQVFYKHPWCAKTHTLSILFLPCFIGNFFEDDDFTQPLCSRTLT